MKLSNVVAPALALATAQAAIEPNSTTPSANGFFYQGEIYFQLYLPKASGAVGFSLLSDISGSDSYGFQFDPAHIFGFYQPSSSEFTLTSDSSATSIDLSADLSFGSDSGAEIYLNGPLTTWKDEFVGLFLLDLEVGAQAKRADPTPIYVTATTTDALPAGLPFTTTGSILGPDDDNTTTETTTYSTQTSYHTIITHSKTTVTITSCSDNKCTEVPVETGVTTVTENGTVYTTYCPEEEETTIYTATTVTTTCTTVPGKSAETTATGATATTESTKAGEGTTSYSTEATESTTSTLPEFNGASNLQTGAFFTLVAGLFALVL